MDYFIQDSLNTTAIQRICKTATYIEFLYETTARFKNIGYVSSSQRAHSRFTGSHGDLNTFEASVQNFATFRLMVYGK